MKKFYSFFAVLILFIAVAGSASAQGVTQNTAPAFRISKVAMAITNVDAMVAFYRNVFNIDFRAVDIGNGVKLYMGTFSGMDILFAPNEIANVKAEQSRMQFDIMVPSLKDAKTQAEASGGSVREEREEAGRMIATLVDPDGNTIVVIEKKS